MKNVSSSACALMLLGGIAALVACGSDGGSAEPDPGANPEGGAPTADGGGAPSPDGGPSVDGPFTFRDRLAGWSTGYTGGFYRAHGYAIANKRLFSVPDALSPTLVAVTVVDVSGAKPRVYSLPVAGKVPAGTVEAFVYEPGSDRMVLIVRPITKGARADIVTIAIGEKEVGGSQPGLDTALLDDVWSFDRASSTWAKVATLPAGVFAVSLSIAASGELLVTGRLKDGQTSSKTSSVYAVDRTTHAVRTMDPVPAATGLWSVTAYRGCFVGYESGDTVDSSLPNLWRCSVADGKITWTSTPLQEHDFVLNGLKGATAPDGLRAYFVGTHLWEAIGK